MAMTTSFMGLRAWNKLLDDYDHDQLTDNWAKIDNHDHTPGRGVLLTTQSFAPESVVGSTIAPGTIQGSNIKNETITLENLSLSLQSKVALKKNIIASEESRTNTAFGTLTVADEIPNVVLAVGEILTVAFVADVKESVENAASIRLAIGSSWSYTVAGGLHENGTTVGSFGGIRTSDWLATEGLHWVNGNTGPVTSLTRLCLPVKEAGTYNIKVEVKSTSGSVTMRNRKLFVGVQ